MRRRATSLTVLARIGVFVVVAVRVVSGAGFEKSAQADAKDGGPYFGKWKVNVARSDFGETMLAFDRAASGEMQMTYLGRSYRFRVDGNDYPAILGMTAAWKQIDPDTWEAVYKRGGNVWTTDTTRLSSDGRALTINSKGITQAGGTNEHNTVYERVSGGSGLIGTWKTKSAPPVGSRVLELVPSGTDGVIITRPDGSCDAKFDGNDYPVHGPSVPAGITWAIRRTGPRSFDWTAKVNGDGFAQTSFTVSDDGKDIDGNRRPGRGQSTDEGGLRPSRDQIIAARSAGTARRAIPSGRNRT